MEMQDIQLIVHRCQQGQLDAFDTLYRHYQSRIFDLACSILQDEAVAEDIVQETFLTIFQKIDQYQGEARFDTWLTAIAVNQCRMYLRKQKVRQVVSLEFLSSRRSSSLHSSDDDVSEIVLKRQRHRSLWDMVDLLNDRLRLPMILRYRYALSCGDIATILNRRKSTVYKQLYEGRRQLVTIVEKREAGTMEVLVK